MVKKVYVFEKDCCGTNPSKDFVSFLQRKFTNEIEVKVFDLENPSGLLPIPPSLLLKLHDQGEECLPALVVDGTLVAERKLPNFLDAVEIVRTGQPSKTSLSSISVQREK